MESTENGRIRCWVANKWCCWHIWWTFFINSLGIKNRIYCCNFLTSLSWRPHTSERLEYCTLRTKCLESTSSQEWKLKIYQKLNVFCCMWELLSWNQVKRDELRCSNWSQKDHTFPVWFRSIKSSEKLIVYLMRINWIQYFCKIKVEKESNSCLSCTSEA